MNPGSLAVFALLCSSGLLACARDAHAEAPKPPPGGHAFDVELVEIDPSGAHATRHFTMAMAGRQTCAKITAKDGSDSVKVSACLGEIDAKSTLKVDLERIRDGQGTEIEGGVPLGGGGRILVGRSDQGAKRIEVYVTGG